MAGLRIRSGQNLTPAWGQVRKRAVRPEGPNVGDPNQIRAKDTRPLEELVAMRISHIQMVTIPKMPGKMIAVEGIKVGLFSWVMAGYEFSDHQGTGSLRDILADPSQAAQPVVVSVFDGKEFAQRLSGLTGRNFRLPTNDEGDMVKELLKGNSPLIDISDAVLHSKAPLIRTYHRRGSHTSDVYADLAVMRSPQHHLYLIEDVKE